MSDQEQQQQSETNDDNNNKPTWSSSTSGGYVSIKPQYLIHGGSTKASTTTFAPQTADGAVVAIPESANNNNNNKNNNNDDDDNNDGNATTTTTTTTTTKQKGMWVGAERANPVANAEKTERPTFEGEINFLDRDNLQKVKHLPKLKNDFIKVSMQVSQEATAKLKPQQQETTTTVILPERRNRDGNQEQEETTENKESSAPAPAAATTTTTAVATTSHQNANDTSTASFARKHVNEILQIRAENDEPIEVRRKRLFDNKLILAPLTTVGNLPFRRLCKELGAEVTCGEMAVSYNLNQLQKSEWSLLRRHESEDIFGLQIACSRGGDAALTSALLHELNFSYDFLDINCCCPVGLMVEHGCGCGLYDRKNRMREVVQNMYHFQSKPVTIKVLIGPDERSPTLHKNIGEYQSWGAESVIVHGRSYRQRYTKSANWDYVEEVCKLTNLPVIGHGDIFCWEDVVERKQFCPSVSGLMVGRGALIKPWIFQEINEQRAIDISSHERFELLKKFCKYGMAHWGADEKGIATTRRFLLEWLSFLCRYVPVGLLEKLPQRINDRPPLYYGRDDMETLMSSDNVTDWIKISEMLLGPVGDKFHFTPKHKSNAYSVTDAEKKEMLETQQQQQQQVTNE